LARGGACPRSYATDIDSSQDNLKNCKIYETLNFITFMVLTRPS